MTTNGQQHTLIRIWILLLLFVSARETYALPAHLEAENWVNETREIRTQSEGDLKSQEPDSFEQLNCDSTEKPNSENSVSENSVSENSVSEKSASEQCVDNRLDAGGAQPPKELLAAAQTAGAEGPFKNPLLAERIGFEDAGSGNFDQIDTVSKQVLQKEIELLKLNTRYRIESTRVDKLKPWRLFAYSLAGNTLVEVGISHIAYARWKYWRRPGLASKAFLRKGPQCLLIGHAIVTGGVMIESAIDMIAQHKQARKGFDRKTCRQRVAVLKNEIETLLKTRENSIQNLPADSVQLATLNLESKVLSDVKDCAVEEFSKLAVREKKIKTARDTAALFTFAQATTGGFIGSLGNLLAVSNRKPRLALPAGVGFAVSGALIALTPPASKIMATLAGNAEKKKESRFFGIDQQAAGKFDSDRTALASALEGHSGGIFDSTKKRLELYTLQNDIMDRQAMMAKAEAAANKKEFMEKLISNSLAGGCKISWGVNLMVAGSAWSNTAPKATPTLPVKLGQRVYRVPIRPMKTPAQLFSRRVAQGATSNIAGPAVGAIDALQSRVRGEIRAHNAKKNGTAPGQILAQRLKTLEEMEAKLK